jgi:signal transduction histidine kinase
MVSQHIGEEEFVVLAFTDQTTEVKLHREQALNEYAQTMFASITHELRTPLNAISHCMRILEPYA